MLQLSDPHKMPGTDYTHAAQPLEQFVSVESAPKLQLDHLEAPALEDQHPTVLQSNGTATNESIDLQNTVPLSPNNQESSLPPTPPLHLNVANDPQLQDSVGSNGSGFVTPTNARSPPTPDITPPRLRDLLTRLSEGSLQHSPSYAASFKTAQEDQMSISTHDSSDGIALPFAASGLYKHSPPVARAAIMEDVFAGIDDPVSDSKRYLRHKPDFHLQDGYYKLYRDGFQSSDSERDGDTTPHYTQRKITSNGYIPISPSARSPEIRDNTSFRTYESLKPEHVRFKDTSNSVSPNDFDQKRLSGTSGSSTIVEAVVIDRTPPPRKRELRHVSKTNSLRDSASPKSNGIRSFEESPSAQLHTLRRSKATIPPRPMTAPEDIVENDGQYDLELIPNQRRVVSEPLQTLPTHFEDFTPPPPSASPASLITDTYYDAVPTHTPNGVPSDEADTNRPGTSESFPLKASEEQVDQRTEEDGKSPNQSVRYSGQSFRQLYGASPMSLKSEATENFEINEASAVKLSAHANSSLVVVDNNTNSNDIQHQTAAGALTLVTRPAEATSGAFGFLAPSNPQQQLDTPLSPLRNPRAAPEPPLIAVTSPNPRDEDLSDESQAELSDDSRLMKQESFFTRARRRYSEGIVNPLSGTLRRNRQSGTKGHSLSVQAAATASEHNGQSHSSWQAGELIDDVSRVREGDPVTQSLGSSNPQQRNVTTNTSVLGEPRRGIGSIKGFLVGNTLGLEREHSNKRRHVVTLPAGRVRKSQLNTLDRRNQAPVTVRQSAKRSGSGRTVKSSRAKVVFQGWREKLKERRWRAQEKAREKKRAVLRNNIEGPFQHDTEII